MKKEYSSSEWNEREDKYIEVISSIVLPISPTTAQIKELTSKLESVYTKAGFEMAFIKRKYERATLDLKNAEAELFNIVKKECLESGNKVTESDVKGMVKTKLKTCPIEGYKSDIYSVLKVLMDRVIFMEQTLKIILEKKSSIIAINTMLKLEHDFSGTKDNME